MLYVRDNVSLDDVRVLWSLESLKRRYLQVILIAEVIFFRGRAQEKSQAMIQESLDLRKMIHVTITVRKGIENQII